MDAPFLVRKNMKNIKNSHIKIPGRVYKFRCLSNCVERFFLTNYVTCYKIKMKFEKILIQN